MKFMVLLLALLVSFSASARSLTTEEKLADLNQLVHTIRTQYGPLQFKKEALGIDLDKLYVEYTEKIKNTESNSEFYYEIIKFVGEFKDGHFGAWNDVDHKGKVHFTVNLVDGKVLIDTIDRAKLSKEKFAFEKGDEVVSINEQDVQIFIDEHKKYRGRGADLSARSSAAYTLTQRLGRFVPVWSGDVTYSIRRGTSDVIEDVTLQWDLSGTPYDEFVEKTQPLGLALDSKIQSLALDSLELKEADYAYHCSGGTRVAVPKDATYIMKKPFVAYYHPTEKGNVGYLRIPHYSPRNAKTGERTDEETDLRFRQYEYAVSVLEENTVGLVIDQDHNCGGSVYYLERILGLFMQEEYPPMDFTFLSNKYELSMFRGWLKELNKNTLAYAGFKTIVELLEDSWKKGDFMTPKTNFRGIEKYKPNHITYSKPILMLIDQHSGSGGDAFPAMMKGLGRAKLFGTQTMGLGGHVMNLPGLYNSGIKFRITKSLFYKPNGDPVENNGAIPDYPYTITRDDFLYEYKSYQKAYLDKLLGMIEKE